MKVEKRIALSKAKRVALSEAREREVGLVEKLRVKQGVLCNCNELPKT